MTREEQIRAFIEKQERRLLFGDPNEVEPRGVMHVEATTIPINDAPPEIILELKNRIAELTP